MTTPTFPSYAGHRFPAEVISHAVWLYFRFPLSLRMVEEMLAARGIIVSHETIRQWALKFGQDFANRVWRAVDQEGIVLDILVQSRRDKWAAKRLLRKLLKRQCRAPRVMIIRHRAERPAPLRRRRGGEMAIHARAGELPYTADRGQAVRFAGDRRDDTAHGLRLRRAKGRPASSRAIFSFSRSRSISAAPSLAFSRSLSSSSPVATRLVKAASPRVKPVG